MIVPPWFEAFNIVISRPRECGDTENSVSGAQTSYREKTYVQNWHTKQNADKHCQLGSSA